MHPDSARELKQVVMIGAGFDTRPYRFGKQMPGVAFYENIPYGGFFRYVESNRFTSLNVLSFYPDVVKIAHLVNGFQFLGNIF